MNTSDRPRVSKLRFTEEELLPPEVRAETKQKARPQRKARPAQMKTESSHLQSAQSSVLGVSPLANEMLTRERPMLHSPDELDLEVIAQKRKELFNEYRSASAHRTGH